MALALSTKAWGDYSEADYSIEQWHAACLIHQHTGPPTSKSQCKLPVKTPSGALNRDGCIAAAGALAGARTPLQASAEEKSSAAKALIRYYGQFKMKPTPKMLALAHSDMSEYIAHYGVKGMHWGVRRAESSGGSSSGPASTDFRRASKIEEKAKKGGTKSLTNKELQDLTLRLNLERNLSQVRNDTRTSSGRKFAKQFLKNFGMQQSLKLASMATAAAGAAALRKIRSG